jgi:hypothetical protein
MVGIIAFVITISAYITGIIGIGYVIAIIALCVGMRKSGKSWDEAVVVYEDGLQKVYTPRSKRQKWILKAIEFIAISVITFVIIS